MSTSLALLLMLLAADPTSEKPRHVGRQIADFKLQDHLGTWHALGDHTERRALVVAFLGADCPLARLYGPRLAELARAHAQDVAFLGINSNQQDTPTEIGHYVRAHGIAFPILKDPGNIVADLFGAQRTPEVFVLDADRTVRYWGRIDDQYGPGYARPDVKSGFLAQALAQLIAGQPISPSEVEPLGCYISRVLRRPPTGDITYAQHVSRILQDRCVQCHRSGGIAPFALTNYGEAASWAETLWEVVEQGRMPPWHASPKYGSFRNHNQMLAEEKRTLKQWLENGVPQGDPADLPPALTYHEQWSIEPPDCIVEMPQPFQVPATGVVDYQYIECDPGLKEDTWVRAAEAMPGNRAVVHHIVAFVQPPGTKFSPDQAGIGFEMLGVYVPGMPPLEFPSGTARLIPAGSKLVFQMHYTPNGTEQSDQSRLGLVFADPQTVRKSVQMGATLNTDFQIPPQARQYPVRASMRVSHDMELHSLTPHMHFRGKSFRFVAQYPNGSREILLDVPRYDFNWQHTYQLTTPKLLPAGTLMQCLAHFDNSEDNPANPDPTATVGWGEQSFEEMMIGYYEGVFQFQNLELPAPQMTQLENGESEVHFRFRPDRPRRSIHLAGTFNDWNNTSHPLRGPDEHGVYSTVVQLKPGSYRYKFVIDGDLWLPDPASKQMIGVLHESLLVVR